MWLEVIERRLPKEVTFKLDLEEPHTEGRGSFQAKGKTTAKVQRFKKIR